MRHPYYLVSSCLLLACSGATGPLLRDAASLELRVDVDRPTVAVTDTLTLRLIAANPHDAPVVLHLPCGHRGLSYQIRDSYGVVFSEPHVELCLHESTRTHTIASGDSLVRVTTWTPRPITTGLHALATPPGVYSAVALLQTESSPPPSPPAAFTIVKP